MPAAQVMNINRLLLSCLYVTPNVNYTIPCSYFMKCIKKKTKNNIMFPALFLHFCKFLKYFLRFEKNIGSTLEVFFFNTSHPVFVLFE